MKVREAVDPSALEQSIRESFEKGDKQSAATKILEGYGREVLGFLLSRVRDDDAASEIFSQFTEDLWRGLDGFQWECSARVWSYALVRHAASRHFRGRRRRRGRFVPLSDAGPLSQIEEKIRTETPFADRTESRNRAAKLRDALPPDDQTLLILRVNRKLRWKEVAQIMSYEGKAVPEAVLEKETARLRKRFELVTDKLRRLAQDQDRARETRS